MPKGSDYAGSRDKKKRRIMRALKINEISGVDVPAQEGAAALIMKRHDDVEKGMGLTSEVDGHTHIFVGVGPGGVELTGGMTAMDETGHMHPWVKTGDMQVVFGAAQSHGGESHTHELAETSKNDADAEQAGEEGKSTNLLNKDVDDNPEAAGDTGTVGTEGEHHMTDNTQKAADDAAVVELQAKLDRANSVAELNDAEKAHFSGLDANDQDAFLAKSASDRKSTVDAIAKAKADSDPIEYTTMDGIDLRKSAGAALISMAKSNDVLRKQNDDLVAGRKQDELLKRAETELAHLPGDLDARAALLKSVDGIEDDGQREAAMKALRAQNEAMSFAFKAAGHGGAAVESSAEGELDNLAKAHAEKNGVSYAKAYSAVLETERGQSLYAKSVN